MNDNYYLQTPEDHYGEWCDFHEISFTGCCCPECKAEANEDTREKL